MSPSQEWVELLIELLMLNNDGKNKQETKAEKRRQRKKPGADKDDAQKKQLRFL